MKLRNLNMLFICLLLMTMACGKSKVIADAERFLSVGEYERATEILELELRENQGNTDARLLLGRVFLERGDQQRADSAFRKVLQQEKRAGKELVADTYFSSAKDLLLGNGDADFVRFEDFIEKAITYHPKISGNISAWIEGELAEENRKLNPTILMELLNTGVSVDQRKRPDYSRTALGLAQAFMTQGQWEAASVFATRAGEIDPEQLAPASSVLLGAAQGQASQGETEAAKRGFEKATQWAPQLLDIEDVFWQFKVQIEDDQVTGARAYLNRFPQGTHRSQVEAILASELLNADFSTDLGGWDETALGWNVAGGMYRAMNSQSNVLSQSTWTAGNDWRDYSSECDITLRSWERGSTAAMLFRYQSVDETCQCRIEGAYGREDQLVLVVPGQQDVSVRFQFKSGETYRIRTYAVARAVGCEVVGYPETRLATFTSGSLQGTVGFKQESCKFEVDNLRVMVADEDDAFDVTNIDNHRKARQTVWAIEQLARGLNGYAVDNGIFPESANVASLRGILSPYVRELPLVDGWGNELVLESNDSTYTIKSYGSDGKLGAASSEDSYNRWAEDILYVDGEFVVLPEGL